MTGQRKLLRINLLIIVSYFLMKFLVRPFVLDNDFPEVFQILVLSYPNFCEAVAGTIVLTFFGLWLRSSISKEKSKPKEKVIYLLCVSVAAVYVLLQEFKVHNLGGNNVYDSYDVLFSIIGLIVAYLLLIWIKPKAETLQI